MNMNLASNSYDAIVKDLIQPGDTVLSIDILRYEQTVECSWNSNLFQILALIEHKKLHESHTPKEVAGSQFIILILEGRAPILSHKNLELVNFIPIFGSLFSCEIDAESPTNENELCLKISPNLTETPLLLRMARGHRSENFIDELFRVQAVSSSDISFAPSFPYYENLVSATKQPQPASKSQFFDEGELNEDYFKFQKNDPFEEELAAGGFDSEDSSGKAMNSMKEREAAIRCILDTKQEQYIELNEYKFMICSWNVNGQSPGSICLTDWLARTPDPPDFYAIGFQELDLSKEAFLFHDSPKETEWLRAVLCGLHPGAKYHMVKLIRLIGMMLIVFTKEEILPQLKNVVSEVVGTGILGKMGNKGGVAIRLDFDETSIVFVNCHLAAHVEEYQRRNQDFLQISSRMVFYLPEEIKYIKDHEVIFWFGDMNYRINPLTMNPDDAKKLIELEKYRKVLDHDQLKDQMKQLNVFPGYHEGVINFRPTYKYDIGTDTWDSSEKNRSPAWCDRILWKENSEIENLILQKDYQTVPHYRLSDHKPVTSMFTTKIKVINQIRYRKVYEDALKRLDKLENEFLPSVTVDIPASNTAPHSNRNEINFGKVKFLEPIKRNFTVANTGQVPVRIEFIKKLNDPHICKKWLTIQPIMASIKPGETCEIELQLLVDKLSAADLNVGKDTLYDILVLHLQNGKDIFITVAGDYERSVFGCSINALVKLIDPLTAISTGQLIDLEKESSPLYHYEVPKELWYLVDLLFKEGVDKPSLFSQSGLPNEILEIRNWLDTMPPNSKIPGSMHSIAESLIILLESFPEPVIPFSLHLKCIDSAHNYMKSKEIIKQLPKPHRNVFSYLCSFLRELLTHSENNGLDVKILALLFGRVMLRDKNPDKRSNPKLDRQKAGFIYQFIVNNEDLDDL